MARVGPPMQCDNCTKSFTPIMHIVARDQNYFCSEFCAEEFRSDRAPHPIDPNFKWGSDQTYLPKMSLPQVSVLSAEDRKTIEEARRWIRYLWQQGLHIDIDGIEHDCLFDLLKKLDSMHARHADEPQLAEGQAMTSWIVGRQVNDGKDGMPPVTHYDSWTDEQWAAFIETQMRDYARTGNFAFGASIILQNIRVDQRHIAEGKR